MIPVTKTFLPPFVEYEAILKQAWDKQWITNRGDLTLLLEGKLKSYLAVDSIIVTNNGTIPIQIALKLLGLGGEIITTPFSYVATTSAIVWENCIPVFVDIHPEYLTIDEEKIEAAITSKTTAILATHVFGNPCNVERIGAIAKKHNLKVIYDGAHSFGVKYNNQSIFNYGDISTCSFHATKLFHTGEGGAMFCRDEEMFHKLFYSHNFGHNGPLSFYGLGINGKISELQSAMGLAVLPHMEHVLEERKKVIEFYNKHLSGNSIKKLRIRNNTEWNNSYYPIIFKDEESLLKIQEILNSENIFPRRYFYPSLNVIEYTNGSSMPIAESISKTILCLPLYVGLTEFELKKIVSVINNVIH
jgi:dTDP-4-amino-4,6-dideoxygalactose transaminase